MSDITDVRCVLTQEALDAFCNTFHILEEVHPVLPNQDDTMHERPVGKIGLYTIFFDFSNFRLPLSTFLVDILRHFRINISQLSVIGEAKVSHIEILCRVYEIVPTVRLFRYMDLFAFIHALDPTKVRVVERERDKDEPRLLETTVGRTISLLPIAPDLVETKLKASVNRLFNEGGSGHQTEQKDYAGGGQDANIQPVAKAADTIVEDAAPVQLRQAERSSALIMTTVTTTTPTFDPTSLLKRNSDFLVGAIRTVINPDTELQKVYVPQWSVTNESRLDDGRVCHEMVDEFSPPKFFVFVRGMKHDQLFTEINVGAARQMSLSAEGELLKAREEEIGSLKARLLLKEAEAAEAIRLCVEASNFKTVEKSLRDEANALREHNVILEKERDALDVKVTKLETSAMSKERELTDLNALVHELEISSSRLQEKAWWLLTYGIELAIAKCLNSPEYLSALETAIGKAIEKANYIFALQQLQNVNFPLLAELKSKKDASVEAIMEILRLEDPVAKKLGLNELQPNVDQMMIRKNIANYKSVLHDVFVSLAEPFSTLALTGMEGTSGAMPTIATITALSTTLALTSTVNVISIDD
nr:transposase (putative), gypsy type [Tanacetum cinerariifolium]